VSLYLRASVNSSSLSHGILNTTAEKGKWSRWQLILPGAPVSRCFYLLVFGMANSRLMLSRLSNKGFRNMNL
jgi:hypothetical protein